MKAIFVIAAMTLVSMPSNAAQPAPPINIIFTAENASCAAWTKSAGNGPVRVHYEFWVRGFVSGQNYANPARQVKVGTFPAGDELYAYFDQYCRDNPQQSFVEAAMHLVEQLRGSPAPKKSTPAPKQPAKAAAPAQ